jgi:CheY-like chemotaxis protein
MMPERRVTFCRELKRDPRFAEIPIVLHLRARQELDGRRGLALGAAAFVTKPYSRTSSSNACVRCSSSDRDAANVAVEPNRACAFAKLVYYWPGPRRQDDPPEGPAPSDRSRSRHRLSRWDTSDDRHLFFRLAPVRSRKRARLQGRHQALHRARPSAVRRHATRCARRSGCRTCSSPTPIRRARRTTVRVDDLRRNMRAKPVGSGRPCRSSCS